MTQLNFLKPNKDIVRVLWVDSTCRCGWRDTGKSTGEKDILCESVGLLAQKTKEILEVVPHYYRTEEKGDYDGNGIMIIPCSAVRKIEILRKGSKK